MAVKCPACKYNNADRALACNLCGEKLAREAELNVDLAGLVSGDDVLVQPLDADDELWLHCPPFNPVPLPRDRKFTIGRSSNNDLVLPVAMVSRNHATIVWDSGQYVLTDLDSANGCYVNAERAQQTRLSPGDRVKIDPYHMEILAQDPAQASQQDAAEQTLNISRSELMSGQTGISGKLSEMPLEDVVQLLGQQRKTGVLKLRAGPGRGTQVGVIYFANGEVVDARHGSLEGEQAFYMLCETHDGTFRFAAEEGRESRTIVRKTPNLLMEAMRLKDEKRR